MPCLPFEFRRNEMYDFDFTVQKNKIQSLVEEMDNNKIEIQKKRIQSEQPFIDILATCRLNEGIIIVHKDEEKLLAEKLFNSDKKITLFIPASGSGSRMFHFLFEFLEQIDETNQGEIERFLTHIEDFAFFNQLPFSFQNDLKNRSLDIEKLVAYILNREGFGLANLPKGLIPFHKLGPFTLSPFQEHVVQGSLLNKNRISIHFTIQQKFENMIKEQLTFLEGMTSHKYQVDFSEQNRETDSIAFDNQLNPVRDKNGELLTRPAGHGALFENFKQLDGDLIFIKNIDNIQHYNQSVKSVKTQQMIGGMFLEVQEKINKLIDNFNDADFEELNFKYQLFHPTTMQLSEHDKISLLKRPLRVCGMVRNEGQQGGGPFWVNNNSVITKQIIEKSQIHSQQIRFVIQSSHFNPVIMVCEGVKSRNDIDIYKDENTYFKVEKSQQGKQIKFIEMPGLWNGSMANWNSVFVEIPSETFSPVKSILDLLNPIHRA